MQGVEAVWSLDHCILSSGGFSGNLAPGSWSYVEQFCIIFLSLPPCSKLQITLVRGWWWVTLQCGGLALLMTLPGVLHPPPSIVISWEIWYRFCIFVIVNETKKFSGVLWKRTGFFLQLPLKLQEPCWRSWVSSRICSHLPPSFGLYMIGGLGVSFWKMFFRLHLHNPVASG